MRPSQASLMKGKPYIDPVLATYLGIQRLQNQKNLTLQAMLQIDHIINNALTAETEDRFPDSIYRTLMKMAPVSSLDIPEGF